MSSKPALWALVFVFPLAVSLAFLPQFAINGSQMLAVPSATSSSASNRASVARAEMYSKLPLGFEQNVGQTASDVRFLARGRGYTLLLKPNEVVLRLAKPALSAPGVTDKPRGDLAGSIPDPLQMELVDANVFAAAEGLEALPGKTNYFIGSDSQKWRTNVPTYAKAQFRDVYPGIDVVYYGNQQQLENDFRVGPNADPATIRLRLKGKTAPFLDSEQNLVVEMQRGIVTFLRPTVYQEISGKRVTVQARYALLPGNDVGFQVGSYDRSQPLVIDPVVSYSTYLGGSGFDGPFYRGIDVDEAGNAYLVGTTESTDFPTANPVQSMSGGGGRDIFVTKLNPTGSSLIYSSYFGGSQEDIGSSIAMDASGNAYLACQTRSADFPTTMGAFQTVFQGGPQDGAAVQLDASGALVYSTYLGGSGEDSAAGIAVTTLGSAYILLHSTSSNFPTTAGSFQPAVAGGSTDVVIAALNSAGSALDFATYLGGSGDDEPQNLDLDSSGNVYLLGLTASTNLPTTPGAPQATNHGGTWDGFVAKLDPTLSALAYLTYLGGSGQDQMSDIAVDSSGSAYVTGSTNSSNFPTTPGTFQTTHAGGSWDVVVSKIDSAGSLVFSTYLGGNDSDTASGINVDSAERAWVVGSTASANFPVASPLQTLNGSADAFVTELNSAGSGLVFSTYFGGASNENAASIAFDAGGNFYVMGGSNSTDFPTTTGAFQTNNNGSYDVFVVKFSPAITTSLALHGTGPVNNPPVLFLDSTAPIGSNSKYRDSASVNFNAGNPWKDIGIWSAAPSQIAGTLTDADNLHVWLGLKNSDDQGTRFDLRAELLRNGSLISSGETYCIQGVTRNANLASEATVSFSPDPSGSFNGTSDVFSVRVLTRIGTNGSGGFCGGHSNTVGLRLYFDSANRFARLDATVAP